MVDFICRKPVPGLLLRVPLVHNLDMKRSWLIRDKLTDIETDFHADATPILVRTGDSEMQKVLADPGFQNE